MQPCNFLRATAYMLSVYMLRQLRPYICLSVTCVDCIKTAEHIIKILSLSDRIILLVFHHQWSLHKSDGFTAMEPNTRGKGSDFQPMWLYLGNFTGIFTMEDEYKFVCSLSNSAAFDDLE